MIAKVEDNQKSQIPGYQLISKIGKGAMASVYKARQLSLDRIVAIKVLPKRDEREPGIRRTLLLRRPGGGEAFA